MQTINQKHWTMAEIEESKTLGITCGIVWDFLYMPDPIRDIFFKRSRDITLTYARRWAFAKGKKKKKKIEKN